MISNIKDAENAVLARLNDQKAESSYFPKEEVMIVDDATIAKPYGWVFFYNSREFLETGRVSSSLAGNGPVVFNRFTGDIDILGTAYPIEEEIRRYESNLSAFNFDSP